MLTHVAARPTEKIINEDPHVRSSVMFGRGKFQNGVLIEPTEDFAIDPMDVKKVEEYRNKIWYAHMRARTTSSIAERAAALGRLSSA